MRKAVILLLSIMITLPTITLAQTKLILKKGDPIRIETSEGKKRIYILGADSSQITFRQLRRRGIKTLEYSKIIKMKVGSPRTRSEGMWMRCKKGFLVGGLSGFLLGIASQDQGDMNIAENQLMSGLIAGGVFGILGGTIGSILGASAPGADWQEVELPVEIQMVMKQSDNILISCSYSF